MLRFCKLRGSAGASPSRNADLQGSGWPRLGRWSILGAKGNMGPSVRGRFTRPARQSPGGSEHLF